MNEPMFYREKKKKSRTITARVTEEEMELLDDFVKATGIEKADVIRMALGEWVHSGPHAKTFQEISSKRTKKKGE